MPHIQVKLWPGRSEDQKKAFAQKIVAAAKETLGATEEYISVAIDEVEAADWPEAVYKPEIEAKMDALYKKPGYKYE